MMAQTHEPRNQVTVMSSTRSFQPMFATSHTAQAAWCVCGLEDQGSQKDRFDYANSLPTSNLIAKPEVGT